MGAKSSQNLGLMRVILLLLVFIVLAGIVVVLLMRNNPSPAAPIQTTPTAITTTQTQAPAVATPTTETAATPIQEATAESQTTEAIVESREVSPLSTPEGTLFVSPLALPVELEGTIAFHSTQSGELQIHTLDLASGLEQQLVNTGRSFEPTWSPDCQQIAFVAERNDTDNFELYIMNRDGSDQRRLIPDQEMAPGHKDWAPTWSPNGDVIAYQSNQVGDLRVCFVTIGGRSLGCFAPGWSAARPAWSPDGNKLVFIGLEDGDWDLFIADVNVTADQVEVQNAQKLTDNQSIEMHPRMSPDGRHIVYESNSQGTYDIMIMNADGSDPRVLAAEGVDEAMPDWLGNDRVLYSAERINGWELKMVNINDGSIEILKNGETLNKWPVWCNAN